MKEILDAWIEEIRPHTKEGKVARYIPALAKQNPNDIAISIFYKNNEQVHAGNYEKVFTLQSVSKVIALALALLDRGEEAVFQKVGMEPTRDPFHSIAKLETAQPSKPLNPMINAGALAVTCMVKGKDAGEKVSRLLKFVQELTNDPTIDYNAEVAQSEFKTANLNRSLCYFMKQNDVITGDVEELLDVYTKQCAIQMNCKQLARIGAVIANNGTDIETGVEIIPKHYARICKTFMVTCGMYDASGSFAIKAGIPAKSGVSGAILGSIKDFGGIAVYGPSLNDKGNSVVGIDLLERVSEHYQLSIF